MVNEQEEVEPASLKQDNPEAYLPSPKDKDQELWMSEMADIGPERYAAELVRIDKEQELRHAEAAARCEAENPLHA
ncbi:hypothetical protein [Ruegeria sp. Alg231-54]|uniref:hypothetical protein n=1 Tax=Ruegeria sp. Alg231-54 TaxID=1922221 RepID=UPI000D55221A|nr:hypothetical protein [Ruegeria sp. Alg231-54]